MLKRQSKTAIQYHNRRRHNSISDNIKQRLAERRPMIIPEIPTMTPLQAIDELADSKTKAYRRIGKGYQRYLKKELIEPYGILGLIIATIQLPDELKGPRDTLIRVWINGRHDNFEEARLFITGDNHVIEPSNNN